MALTHATEPRVLFGWFLQIRNHSSLSLLCLGTRLWLSLPDGMGAMSHSPPATTVHPWGTSRLAGSTAGLHWVPYGWRCACSEHPGGWEKGERQRVTPEGDGSARGDSDSPWETEWWQSWETSSALAVPSSLEHSAAWERAEAHRADVLPAGSTQAMQAPSFPRPTGMMCWWHPAAALPGDPQLPTAPQVGPGAPIPKRGSKTSCILHFKKGSLFQRETKVLLAGRKTPGGQEGCKLNRI